MKRIDIWREEVPRLQSQKLRLMKEILEEREDDCGDVLLQIIDSELIKRGAISKQAELFS